jgi:hypothetical protein
MSNSPDSDDETDARRSSSRYKQLRAIGQVELGARHRLLAELIVFGTDHRRTERLGLPLNEPLTLEQAAAVLNIKRRNARQIFSLPAFQKMLTQAIGDLRSGARPRAIKTLIDMMTDEGAGTAADKAVRIKAAMALLDEGKGVSVNVQVNNQTNLAQTIRPGYVLDLGALYGRRHDDDGPPTIEGKREPRTPDAEPTAADGWPE